MIELALGVLIGAILSVFITKTLKAKFNVLDIGRKYRQTFYELANELLEYEDLSQEHIETIVYFSAGIRKFTTQLIVTQASKEAHRDLRKGVKISEGKGPIAHPSDDWSDELKRKWREMRFCWLIGVLSQGTLFGYGSVRILLDYLEDAERGNMADATIRRFENNAGHVFSGV